jgi:short-subunit dehydrogenase
MKWNGSVAIITGASRGIGAAVARAAARNGARVGLIARAKDDLESVLAECGGNGAVATADVSVRAEIEDAIASLERALGPAQILVNNAGAGHYAKIVDADAEVFERLMKLNYLGTVYGTKAVLPGMIARGAGHIVNVGSIVGRVSAPMEAAYSASKFAVAGFTDALRAEVHAKGIGVSMVDPGPVATDFFRARGSEYKRSFPKPVSAETVAHAVVRAVEKNVYEQYVPSWLRAAPAMQTLFPPLFRRGTAKNFGKELD